MLKKILMGSLAAGALALGAPAALADTPTADCGFNSVQQDDATGQNYEGAAYGYVIHSEGTPVSIRCYVTVNGAEVSSTPTQTGVGAVATAGRVTYQAADTDVVELCAEYTTSHGTQTDCGGSQHFQVPPQEVIDALDSVFAALNNAEITYVDPAVCPVLASHAGTYGPIVINDQGDVFVNGDPQWDCPPYDLFG